MDTFGQSRTVAKAGPPASSSTPDNVDAEMLSRQTFRLAVEGSTDDDPL